MHIMECIPSASESAGSFVEKICRKAALGISLRDCQLGHEQISLQACKRALIVHGHMNLRVYEFCISLSKQKADEDACI